ncbi:MAG: VOC family protein [Vicinamibacterales bacterium]
MHVDRHAPGSFCWFELATTDQNRAKAFYASLFGWAVNDTPLGPSEVYTIFQKDGRDAAAAYTMRPDQRAESVPPHWLVYVLVQSVDATAKRAPGAHGIVLAQPFDVMESGRMAILADPTGATLAIWEPRRHHGTGIVHADGTAVWADLNTPDPAKAAAFYRDLFGWKIVAGKNMAPVGPNDYGHIVNGDEFIGGLPPASNLPPGAPAHWLIYFAVPDCDAAAARTKAAGGAILMPPMTMKEVRKFAVLADPQGAAFAVVETTR